MEYWEFLLQKEGDRTWQLLESSVVQIQEGRYRVAARCSRTNTEVDIRITHESGNENPPMRRTQKQSRCTNAEGLMVVIPFNYLKPGIWEFRCRPDFISDLFSDDTWQHTLLLQVLPASENTAPNAQAQDNNIGANLMENSETQQNSLNFLAVEDSQDNSEASLTDYLQAKQVIHFDSPPAEQQHTPPMQENVVEQASDSSSPIRELTQNSPIEQGFAISSSIPQSSQATFIQQEYFASSSIPQAQENPDIPVNHPQSQPSEAEDANIARRADSESFTETLPPSWRPPVPASSSPVSPHLDSESSSPRSVEYPHALKLILDQDTYVTGKGKAVTISGRVETVETTPGVPGNQPLLNAELLISLRDPQNSQLLLEVRQILPSQVPPLPFSYQIHLPPQINTRLILGDVTLGGVTSATTSFTITVDVDGLLSVLADDKGKADNPDLRSSSKKASPDLSQLDRADTSREVTQVRFEPSEGLSLPPLLHKSPLKKREPKPLALPELPSRYPPKPPSKAKSANTDEEDKSKDSAQDEAQQDVNSENETATVGESELEINLTEDSEDTISDAESSTPQTTSIVLSSRDRLFSRLNALATDEELSDWLQEIPPLEPLDIDLDPIFGATADPDAHLTAMEIVVDDEPSTLQKQLAAANSKSNFAPLPKDEPIPTPKLEVLPAGELTSGQKVLVRITLPYGLPRLGVKLWIQDRQTRSLLEDPRWIGNFAPNGWGQVEATNQIPIPFGCLEIRFAAIATEVQTNRESHKVTVDRIVMPPDLPIVTVDELQF